MGRTDYAGQQRVDSKSVHDSGVRVDTETQTYPIRRVSIGEKPSKKKGQKEQKKNMKKGDIVSRARHLANIFHNHLLSIKWQRQ